MDTLSDISKMYYSVNFATTLKALNATKMNVKVNDLSRIINQQEAQQATHLLTDFYYFCHQLLFGPADIVRYYSMMVHSIILPLVEIRISNVSAFYVGLCSNGFY